MSEIPPEELELDEQVEDETVHGVTLPEPTNDEQEEITT